MPALRVVDHSKDRYHALAISSAWDINRIRSARALVIGAGALGNEVSKNLAMMGVNLIMLVDRDTVEMANLSRSIFFRERDHGRPKTEVVSQGIKELNPEVRTLTFTGDLDSLLGLGLIRRADMIFSCLDSRIARRSVNRLCGKVGKAWVDGAMEDLLGDVAVYGPGDGPCYECGLSQAEKAAIAEVASCRGIALRNIALGKVPTTPTMGSIVSALQVQEAIKILQGDLAGSLANRRLIINCKINDFYVVSAERNPYCSGHERFGEVTEVKEFTAEYTSPRDLLDRFKRETGEDGWVDFGREIVIDFRCLQCDRVETVGEPIHLIDVQRQRCPVCSIEREMKTTHLAQQGDPWSSWPLMRLGIPLLDVIEVRGANAAKWYELSGDCATLELPLATQELAGSAA
jgi:adenylyltransferase/sulfurtransferase